MVLLDRFTIKNKLCIAFLRRGLAIGLVFLRGKVQVLS